MKSRKRIQFNSTYGRLNTLAYVHRRVLGSRTYDAQPSGLRRYAGIYMIRPNLRHLLKWMKGSIHIAVHITWRSHYAKHGWKQCHGTEICRNATAKFHRVLKFNNSNKFRRIHNTHISHTYAHMYIFLYIYI